jgi:hypothetical protein
MHYSSEENYQPKMGVLREVVDPRLQRGDTIIPLNPMFIPLNTMIIPLNPMILLQSQVHIATSEWFRQLSTMITMITMSTVSTMSTMNTMSMMEVLREVVDSLHRGDMLLI